MRCQNKLGIIAYHQKGYFSSRQAITAGFRATLHSYHCKTGEWQRVRRGIYRLSHISPPPGPEFMPALLWTCDKDGNIQGTLSHMSALHVRGLVAVPDKRQTLTVPTNFRRNSTPDKTITLINDDLSPGEIETYGPFRVTTIEKTFEDLAAAGYSETITETLKNHWRRFCEYPLSIDILPSKSPEPIKVQPKRPTDKSWDFIGITKRRDLVRITHQLHIL